jgi:hypothetical protein
MQNIYMYSYSDPKFVIDLFSIESCEKMRAGQGAGRSTWPCDAVFAFGLTAKLSPKAWEDIFEKTLPFCGAARSLQ